MAKEILTLKKTMPLKILEELSSVFLSILFGLVNLVMQKYE